MKIFLICGKYLASAFVASAIFGCGKSPESPTGSAESTIRANPQLQVADPHKLSHFENNTSVVLKLRKIMTQGSNEEVRRQFSSDLQKESEADGYEHPMDFAAYLIVNAGGEHEQIATLGQILYCFPDVTDHLSLYKSLPAGRLRSTSAAGTASFMFRSNNLTGLRWFYEELDLGRDRVQIATNLATLGLREEGLGAALDTVRNFDMSEERYAAMTELIFTKEFEEAKNTPGITQKVESIVATFSSREQEALLPLIAADHSIR